MGMFEPKTATQQLAIQQIGRAVTPELLSAAHQAGEMAASVYYHQAERLLSVSMPSFVVENGKVGGMRLDSETDRQVSELQRLASDAYVASAARVLGVDPAALARPAQ